MSAYRGRDGRIIIRLNDNGVETVSDALLTEIEQMHEDTETRYSEEVEFMKDLVNELCVLIGRPRPYG